MTIQAPAMAISSSAIPSPAFIFHNNTNKSDRNFSFYRNPLLTNTISRPSNQRFSTITVSSTSGHGLSSEDKKLLLERYGFNADENLYQTKTRKTKKKEFQKKGRGKEGMMEEEAKPKPKPPPPRTLHKLLQVLGGTAKRTKLLSPQGNDVRPMMEVVKGAAFDILQAAGGNPAALRPGRWLDLYSGTGSVGIEAISRGCTEAHFVEMDPWVVSNVLKPNLEDTGFLDDSVIHTARVEKFLEQADKVSGNNGPFDFISVTPPYMEVDYGVLMSQISKSPVVGEDTFIVVEYPVKTDILDSCGCLVKITDRKFGRTQLAIYGPQWAQKQRKS